MEVMFMARVYTEIIDLYIENKDVYYTSGWVNAEYYRRNCKNGDKIKAVSLRYYDIVLGKRASEGVEELKIDSLKISQIYQYSFTIFDGEKIIGRLLFICREREFNEVMKFYTQPYILNNSYLKFKQVYKEDIINSIKKEYEL